MSISVAAVQLKPQRSVDANLNSAAELLAQAADAGAQLAVLPENFAYYGQGDLVQAGLAESEDQGPVRQFLREQAIELGVWLVAGTVPVAGASSKPSARCYLLNPQGEIVNHYDKIHLFDVDVADSQGSYRESDTFLAGNDVVVVDTPFGRLGLAICYDIRFPEFFRAIFAQGVDLIAIPAAFTLLTGKAHWLPLLQARAIENQCYIIGANQGGDHTPSRSTSGDSVIIDSWGKVLASKEKGAGYASAEVDLDELAKHRKSMPIQQHQRFTVSPKKAGK